MNCKAINKLLAAYLDKEVTPEEAERIQAHLYQCQRCNEELMSLTATQEHLRQALRLRGEGASPSPQAWVQLQQRLEMTSHPSLLKRLGDILSKPAWRTVTATVLVAVLVIGTLWGTGIIPLVFMGGKAPPPAPAPTPAAPPAPSVVPAPIVPMAPGGEQQERDVSTVDETLTDRKIVRTGRLTLEVTDIADATDTITRLAGELSGYVVSSRIREHNGEVSGSIIIRVPLELFDEVFSRLRQFAVDMLYESTQSQDITEEYTDLNAQLRNLEATEAQYLALLAKAEKVEDILMVQRELSDVRRDIERIKGRMQYLERTSDMSLIEINLEEAKSLRQTGWSAFKTFQSAVRGLTTFIRVLADIAIWLGIFCWLWIPVLVFLLRRRRKAAKLR